MGKTEAQPAPATASSGMWCNPIGDCSDEAVDRQSPSRKAGAAASAAAGGGSLADGELDEEKERAVRSKSTALFNVLAVPNVLTMVSSQEFAKAVAAWRNAGKSSSEGTGTAAPAPASGESVAEKLARAMEAEHEKVVAQLQEEQEAARRRIVEVRQSDSWRRVPWD